MKWLSVKKYLPHIGGEYLVSTSEFCYVAKYNLEGIWTDYMDEEIGGVTHFAVIDPVEIEE